METSERRSHVATGILVRMVRGARVSRAAPTLVIGVGVLVWTILIAAGLMRLSAYSTAPGASEAAPYRWPSESHLSRGSGQSTLLMFVHPKCPCTRASLSELNVVMNASGDGVAASVIFLRPPEVSLGWERSDTWGYAGNIPHAIRVLDESGVEAARFGALTSGHVVLYDPEGRLQFSGGITDSRGHIGDNVGRRTLLALLTEGTAGQHAHLVFGCPMNGPAHDDTGARKP